MRDPATVTESGDGAGLEGPIFPLIAEDHVFSHGDSTSTVFNRPAFLKHWPLSAETLQSVSSEASEHTRPYRSYILATAHSVP
jgi:hypothetical protein